MTKVNNSALIIISCFACLLILFLVSQFAYASSANSKNNNSKYKNSETAFELIEAFSNCGALFDVISELYNTKIVIMRWQNLGITHQMDSWALHFT